MAPRSQFPKWSADGNYIAYPPDRSGRDEIWISDPEGRAPKKITDADNEKGALVWTPDSKSLPYTAADKQPDLICVVSIPPGGIAQARYLYRRLRAKLPHTPILVIRPVVPGVQTNATESAQKLTADGASQVCFTLEDARVAVEQQLVLTRAAAATAAPP